MTERKGERRIDAGGGPIIAAGVTEALLLTSVAEVRAPREMLRGRRRGAPWPGHPLQRQDPPAVERRNARIVGLK